MTQEEKQLLLKDICARLPYGVRYKGDGGWGINPYQHTTAVCTILNSEEPLLYLRPMSSMTEDEAEDYIRCKYSSSEVIELRKENGCNISTNIKLMWLNVFDFLDAHHFDYRGLIEKGLALEAPEGMYKTK